ncbi:probable starch synthase 4, chloroplastic/amyloplastic isoform X2 [Asparagus officinalis]|uniref:probable starch synthase 4, chloroplastic/amyloplastic isoform X2 n=1 Tax=Asparagus officinalis TaxID=4686 RepID=UPI00098E1E1C|nr:probable starch synthase 4, chloroplastic/amyloplastic isoform X2 [Asparagus officinalis]
MHRRRSPSVAVSCKMRPRKLRSQQKRQRTKNVSPKRLPLKMNFQSHVDEREEIQKVTRDSIIDASVDTLSSSVADTSSITKTDDTLTSAGENIIPIKNTDEAGGHDGGMQQHDGRVGRQKFQNVHLEDLIDMIKNAENTRVRALEDLDKIISEKEALQAEINALEMKLAETDARIRVAAQEKIKVEFLENQLEKLKTEMASRSSIDIQNISEYENAFNIQNSKFLQADIDASPLDEDLSSLRKENMLLMKDIQTLKSKLSFLEQTEERLLVLEKEKSLLEDAIEDLEFRLSVAQKDVSELTKVKTECRTLWEKVENLQELLDNATEQANQAVKILEKNHELRRKVEELEAALEHVNASKVSSNKSEQYNERLHQKIKLLEERLKMSEQEIQSHVQLYRESVKEFESTLNKLEERDKREDLGQPADDMPWEFWSRVLLSIDGWLLEKKISSDDAKLLREMAWKRDGRIRDTYLACKGMHDQEAVGMFLKLVSSPTRRGLNIVHIAAEMAPVAKVGGLGDVVSGLSKALQRKGHLVEIVLPKYDCMEYERITDLKALDVDIQSYFDGQLFKNKIWVGTVEGLPVYFIEPHHPAKLFWRGQLYGEHDDFKRFSFFSRAALELLYQAGKRPDIIHCHDWQTAFVAPLYWEIYSTRGLNSARICFTCHNFEYQGTTSASELSSCGLDVHHLKRPDRMQDNSAHDRINPTKGAIVYSNIVTTVSPTYAQEVRTAEGGHGLHETLNTHAKKFVGILNGIDTDAWNPSTDDFLRFQYNADDLKGKADNKDSLRKLLKLSSSEPSQPMVGCITRLVPQKGVHLIRHAIYRTLELGGQFLLLGSSPVPHIQREFEGIAKQFQSHPDVRLLLKYDEALSHSIYAACDMFIVPSIFEPCGLTQMIAMRYGAVPIVRRTGGLNDTVFDVDDDTIPFQYRNGFTFLTPNEEGLNGAMERAFDCYKNRSEIWQQFVQKVMRIDFSWDSSAEQYEELYQKAVARARAAATRV